MNEVGESPRCEMQTIELEQEIREQVVLTTGADQVILILE